MKDQKLKILNIEPVTHNVKRFRLEKPAGLAYEPGQATELSIDREGWREEGRPFTFTSLPGDGTLEFMIKRYDGVTDQLHKLQEGDTLILNDVFGTIGYRGKGLFIAGGAGITPFIAILRQLREKGELEGNSLLFANKTRKDIILEKELKEMLGNRLTSILSEEEHDPYLSGYISRELIADQIPIPGGKFYVCGPPSMMDAVLGYLSELEIPEDSIIIEED